jgi:nickel transport protein
MNKIGPVLLLVLFPALPLRGHDLWVTNTDDGYAVMRGHLPDRFDLYEPECVQTLIALDEKGLPLPLKRLDRKRRVFLKTPSDPALVAVVSKWGYRIIDADGKKQFMSKAEALQSGVVVKEAFFSTQYSKTLFRFNDGFARPLGIKFEVVPLKSPLGLQEGDLLPVQVLFDGAPLAKAKIEQGRQSAPVETDREGRAQIPIQAKGWQKIRVVHDAPATRSQDIDYDRYCAFLIFELK